ncbi:type VI secretion system-associated FHA domain protein TagH [Massilia sp. TSP1-1-2]|uniref:type VI secretion system-associated FHA domain protein TagH n=1 Tax=Massilia sp. TSP1-1-2 TaxID=2804649 RepID=UPI003CED3EDB
MYLRILTYRNQPVPPAGPVGFAKAGGTIGRAPDNALVLDDASKYISRVHAKVALRDGVFMLEDVGSNPSVVNDRPLGKGKEVALAHGDRVTIGDYQLMAVIEAGMAALNLPQAPLNNPDLPLFVPPPPPPPVQLPPLELTPRPASGILSASTPPPAIGMLDALSAASILDVGPGDSFQVGGADPLGLNLFGDGADVPRHAAESDHVSPELAAFSMPAMFAAAPPVPASAPALAPAAPGSFAFPADYDPLADFFAPPLAKPAPPVYAPPPVPTSAPAFVPDELASFDLGGLTDAAPSPVAPPMEIAPPAAAPAPSTGAADSEILQALLRGLGLPELRFHRPATEVAEIVGSMLREATAGTIDVLMARALTKKESRMDVTILSVRENNPLKFFPNAEGALTQMLTGTMAGYMAPSQAMAGAFDDLRAHELAVIAGMRAALAAVLHRFDPDQIEARLAVPTVMDKMLSSNRKAKMWDRLVELYGEIAREADDDLQRLFGEKFAEAYEDQVARLRQAKKAALN